MMRGDTSVGGQKKRKTCACDSECEKSVKVGDRRGDVRINRRVWIDCRRKRTKCHGGQPCKMCLNTRAECSKDRRAYKTHTGIQGVF